MLSLAQACASAGNYVRAALGAANIPLVLFGVLA